MTPGLLFFQVGRQAVLADAPKGRGTDFQSNPLTGFGNEEALFEQVWQKAATCLAVGVRYVVPGYRPLSC